MKDINVKDEEFEEVELLGIRALFTQLRIDKASVPEELYYYGLRHSDDGSFPLTVENNVIVNYYGAILTTERLNLGTEDYLPLGYDDLGFTGGRFHAEDFLEKSRLQRGEVCGPEED